MGVCPAPALPTAQRAPILTSQHSRYSGNPLIAGDPGSLGAGLENLPSTSTLPTLH